MLVITLPITYSTSYSIMTTASTEIYNGTLGYLLVCEKGLSTFRVHRGYVNAGDYNWIAIGY